MVLWTIFGSPDLLFWPRTFTRCVVVLLFSHVVFFVLPGWPSDPPRNAEAPSFNLSHAKVLIRAPPARRYPHLTQVEARPNLWGARDSTATALRGRRASERVRNQLKTSATGSGPLGSWPSPCWRPSGQLGGWPQGLSVFSSFVSALASLIAPRLCSDWGALGA